MSICNVTLSANAGVVIQLGTVKLWSDVLHNTPVPGFSSVSPSLFQAVLTNPAFDHPDFIYYSHCHPDHYSRELTQKAIQKFPNATLILPEHEFEDQILIRGVSDRLSLKGLEIKFGKLEHEEEHYVGVPHPHYGSILNWNGFHILMAGDCAVGNPELADFIGDTPIDLALMNFPWVTLRKGRQFIEQYIQPKHLLVYHIPFAQDDNWGYRPAAEKAITQLNNIPDIRLLNEAFQTETY